MNPLIQEVLNHSVLIGREGKPIACRYFDGNEQLLTVTGDNASGKSIFRRAITQLSRKSGLEVMHFSPEGKAKGGIVGSMIYGPEDDRSTGCNSAGTILKALSTSSSRESDHVIVFDEPDIGLSDEYAAGAGREILKFCQETNRRGRVKLVVIISHRRCFMRELIPLSPSHLALGHEQDLRQWIDRPIVPKDLGELKTADRRMFRAIAEARMLRSSSAG